jgi:septal ring-binding cell division protein DamX
MAEKVASTYEDRFDSVQVVSSTVEGTRRYRVTVGQYPSQAAAERFLSERDSIPAEAWLLERP